MTQERLDNGEDLKVQHHDLQNQLYKAQCVCLPVCLSVCLFRYTNQQFSTDLDQNWYEASLGEGQSKVRLLMHLVELPSAEQLAKT